MSLNIEAVLKASDFQIFFNILLNLC